MSFCKKSFWVAPNTILYWWKNLFCILCDPPSFVCLLYHYVLQYLRYQFRNFLFDGQKALSMAAHKLFEIFFLGDVKPVKCPREWVAYRGHCYRIYRTPKIWKQAQSSCRKEDGDLTSIHNIEEYSFIVSQLGYSEYFYFFFFFF